MVRIRAVVCLLDVLTASLTSTPMVEMAHSSDSNVFIQRSTFNSPQGDLHIHNRDSESGMHNLWSDQKSILIDDSMKDLIPC